jgi:hypothetical protein
VKKLICIGVALALLALVVVPATVGATAPYTPETFAKIPFAIIADGLNMTGTLLSILTGITPSLGIPTWLPTLIPPIADFTAGPLSWSVDMVAWMIKAAGYVLNGLAPVLGLPTWISGTCDNLSKTIWWCYNVTCVPMP